GHRATSWQKRDSEWGFPDSWLSPLPNKIFQEFIPFHIHCFRFHLILFHGHKIPDKVVTESFPDALIFLKRDKCIFQFQWDCGSSKASRTLALLQWLLETEFSPYAIQARGNCRRQHQVRICCG
uniref:Uncharacterized protein n=1 Tax=Varanus komodoensis TaxID=61221 RepID=A0A8D2LY90_VARKO